MGNESSSKKGTRNLRVKTFEACHDYPNRKISTIFERDLRNSNDEIATLFKLNLEQMNKRIVNFNYEKKKLQNLDLFVLDNTLQESTVGNAKPCTLEEKWELYNQVKKVGIQYIAVASFNSMTCVSEQFLCGLNDACEDMSNTFAFVEFFDICWEYGVPKDELPRGLKRCKHFRIPNVVLEVDLAYHGIDYSQFSAAKMCSLLSERFRWIRKNLCEKSLIIVNIRDFTECMRTHPARVFSLVNYLATLSDKERIFGIACEDGGTFYPEQLAVWTFGIREEMKRMGWSDGHLLVNIREQYGTSTGTTLDCLADGATGIWGSVCEEGSGIGQVSSCATIMNLIRLGNEMVPQKYNCNELKKASQTATWIITGNPPHARQPITGNRALDINFQLESLDCEERKSPAEEIIKRLIAAFGHDDTCTEQRAHKMVVTMYEEIDQNRREDYDSDFGLAKLYERSGGELSCAMENLCENRLNKSDQLDALIDEIRHMWDEWNMKDETEGQTTQCHNEDELDYFAFYKCFLAPYFATNRNSQTDKLLETISLYKNGKVHWDEFMFYLAWACNAYPDTECSTGLLKTAFQEKILPLIMTKARENVQRPNDSGTEGEEFYKGYKYKDDEFFTDVGNKVMYRICLKTEDVSDALVFITLYGCGVETAQISLPKLECNAENIIEVEALDVGVVSHIRICRQDCADDSTWCLSDVFVDIPCHGCCFYFPGGDMDPNEAEWELNAEDEDEDDWKDMQEYRVHLITGVVPFNFQRRCAYITFYGEKGSTGKLSLNDFKTKRDNKFILKSESLGKITKIRIGHDIWANQTCWHLKDVCIEDPVCASKVYFKADRWIGTTGSEPWTQDVDLHPEGTGEQVSYDIWVNTGGSESGKKICGDSYIILYGEKGNTGKYPIGELKEKTYNSLRITTIDVGKISRVRIGHEIVSDVERWHLIGVEIYRPGFRPKFNFPANRWMGPFGGPCTLDVDLSLETGDFVEYIINMTIANCPDTDLNAYINIYGDNKRTGKLAFSDIKGGCENRFILQGADVGPIKKIRIGHEVYQDMKSWHLSKISIEVPSHDSVTVFSANRHLGTKDGNGTLDVDLYSKQKGKQVCYEISVLTGDVPYDSHDANAYIILYGNKVDTGKLPIKTVKGNCDNTFTFEAIDVGAIASMRFGHEVNADFESWHLSEICVNIPSKCAKSYFPVCQRLGTKGDNWTRKLHLFPEKVYDEEIVEEFIEPPTTCEEYKVKYQVNVTTGTVPVSDKNCHPYIILCGNRGFTGKLPLLGIVDSDNVNYCTVEAEDIGDVHMIRIGYDVRADRTCWYLREVAIINTGSRVCFQADRWIGTKGFQPYTLDVDLYPKAIGKPIKYDITMKIGDSSTTSGIQDGAYIMIFGDNGDTGKYPIGRLWQNCTASFTIEAIDVGKVIRTRIGYENRGEIDCWYLAEADVHVPMHDMTYHMPADRWLGTKRDNCTLDVDIQPQEEGTIHYEITLTTGDIPHIDADSNAYIKIYGANRQTGKLPIAAIKQNAGNFFDIKAVDVGAITKIKVGQEYHNGFKQWFLKKVFINVPAHQSSLKFRARRTLGENGTLDVVLHPKGKVDLVNYDINVRTSYVPEQTFNMDAYIILFGHKGNTGKLPLKSPESFAVNLNQLEAIDVGRISDIRIGYERHDAVTSWGLNDVIVKIPARGSRVYFLANIDIGTEADVRLYPRKDKEVDAPDTPEEPNKEHVVSIYQKDDKVRYDIHLVTGMVPPGDGNAYIMLFGEKGNTGKVPAKELEENVDNWFILEGPDLGKIIKMRVGQDVNAKRKFWYLKEAFVEVPESSCKVTFSAKRWIGTKAPYACTINADLFPEGENITYSICVTTGGKKVGKAINGDVYISLSGEHGNTGKYAIDRLKLNSENWYTMESIDIGEINTIRIGHNRGDDVRCWLLKDVLVNVPKHSKTFRFLANRNIGTRGKLPCTSNVDIFPKGTETVKYDISFWATPDGFVNCNAFINIFGEKGRTGKLPLKCIKGNQRNEISVHGRDVGPITEIRIGHGNPKICTNWELSDIDIHIPKYGSKMKFPANCQLGINGTLKANLYPKEKVSGKEVDYEVCLNVGDVPDYKVSANAYIIIFGRKKKTGKLPLVTLKRNTVNYFTIRAIDVGKIRRVKIGHEDHADFKSWFLSDVTITNQIRGFTKQFPVGRRLGTKGNGCTMDIEVFPEKEEDVEHEIVLKTGEVPDDVGHNANVYVIFCGQDGESRKLPLGSFRAHDEIVCPLSVPDIGCISGIRIGQDCDVAGWQLISVSLNSRDHELTIPVNTYLGTKNGQTVNEVKLRINKDERRSYTIHVYTEDVPDGCIDANAYIIIFGKGGKTGKIHLKSFEANADNIFEIEACDVGKVKRIRIGHENEADFTNWHLDCISMETRTDGEDIHFPANRWIGTKGENSWTPDADLYPRGTAVVHYNVHLKTSEVPDAQNDPQAYIVLYGEKNQTGKFPLPQLRENYDNLLEIDAPDVGRITKIRIAHDERAYYAGWRLCQVFVNNVDHESNITFDVDQLIGTEGDNVSREVDLFPKEKGIKIKYEVTLRTGDVPDAGCNPNAYVVICGEKGKTGKLALNTLEANQDNLFELEAVDVGEVFNIRVGHNATTNFECWQLNEVLLHVPSHCYKRNFCADRQLGVNGGVLDCELFPIKEEDLIDYDVSIKTGHVPDSGKDANAYIILYGVTMRTGKHYLKTLERNKDNRFVIKAVDVGEIERVRIGHEVGANFEAWDLKEVSVDIPYLHCRFNFSVNVKLGTKGIGCTKDIDLKEVHKDFYWIEKFVDQLEEDVTDFVGAGIGSFGLSFKI